MQFHEFDQAYVERLCSGDFRTEQHFVSYFSELIQPQIAQPGALSAGGRGFAAGDFHRVCAALRSEQGVRQPERLGAFVNSVCNQQPAG